MPNVVVVVAITAFAAIVAAADIVAMVAGSRASGGKSGIRKAGAEAAMGVAMAERAARSVLSRVQLLEKVKPSESVRQGSKGIASLLNIEIQTIYRSMKGPA
jgi:hypothetical protein